MICMFFILALRRKGAKKTLERGNRRTDEQGTLSFEVPEPAFILLRRGMRYFLTTALERSAAPHNFQRK